MIVPLVHLGHTGGKGAQVSVQQIVAIVAAKLIQGFCHFGLGGCDHVAPHLAIVQHHFRLKGIVGVDMVAAEDEKIGVKVAHHGKDGIAATAFIDTPTLATQIARPQKAHRL